MLADNWDKGWRAYWKGQRVPVLRVNYTIHMLLLFLREKERWNSCIIPQVSWLDGGLLVSLPSLSLVG